MKKMKISVTEAARNFADCVNRVRYQKASFTLVKKGIPVAELVPENEVVCTGRDLARALAEVQLSAEEAKTWSRDLKKARKFLKPPVDKWR